MARLITAQPKFKMLVANLAGGSDPSRNSGGNPVKVRTGFEKQMFPEVARGNVATRTRDPHSPGLHTLQGQLDYTTPPIPVVSTGDITVSDTDFSDPAVLYIREYTITSGDDYDVTTGSTYAGENITGTAPNGIIVIWKTAGAGMGEGTIGVPVHLPIEPGSVTFHWTSGVAKSQTVNNAGVFAGDGNPAGSSINFGTGAITLDTTGAPPSVATTITIGYTAVITAGEIAANLAAVIDDLPGFSAAAVGATVTVADSFGPNGDDTDFDASYLGVVENFTLSPDDGYLNDGEPVIGPPTILP